MNRRRSLAGWLSAAGIVPLLAIAAANLPTSSTLGATTYTVFNSPNTGTSRVEGSEELDLVLTGNEKFAIVVGSNEGGAVTPGSAAPLRVRAVRLAPTPVEITPAFEIRTNYPGVFDNGTTLDWRVSNIALHPTQGYAIITLRDAISANPTPGRAIFVDINATSGAITKRAIGGDDTLTLGVFPDSVEIAPNGQYAVVSNSDERFDPDPLAAGTPGSIQIIDLRGAAPVLGTTIQPAVPPGDTLDMRDPQPETVAIAPNSARAFVSLQANNAITILDIDPATLAPTATTQLLGRNPANGQRLHPDGLHAVDIGGAQYLITADEGWSGAPTYAPGTGNRPGSVSLYQVGAGPSLTRINGVTYANAAHPEKLDIGTVAGALRAFVSLGNTETPGQTAVLGIAPTGLTQETLVNLVDSTNAANIGRAPTGVAVGPSVTYNGLAGDLIVVANRNSQNVSVIFARIDNSVPSPSPSAAPSGVPSAAPSGVPSAAPSAAPSASPSAPAEVRRTFLPLAQQ